MRKVNSRSIIIQRVQQVMPSKYIDEFVELEGSIERREVSQTRPAKISAGDLWEIARARARSLIDE